MLGEYKVSSSVCSLVIFSPILQKKESYCSTMNKKIYLSRFQTLQRPFTPTSNSTNNHRKYLYSKKASEAIIVLSLMLNTIEDAYSLIASLVFICLSNAKWVTPDSLSSSQLRLNLFSELTITELSAHNLHYRYCMRHSNKVIL